VKVSILTGEVEEYCVRVMLGAWLKSGDSSQQELLHNATKLSPRGEKCG
jgi:hypothetical protein